MEECKIIEVPGVYRLMNDISKVGNDCFEIRTNDIVIDGNGYSISGTGVPSRGVYSNGFENITIRNFESFSNFQSSIYFRNVLGGIVHGNNFVSSIGGVVSLYGYDVEIYDNFMEEMGTGISVSSISGAGANSIYDNVVIYANTGLSLRSTGNIVERNVFSFNDYGIGMDSLSNANLIQDNFLNNKKNVRFFIYDGYGLSQDWNNSIGGNYWSNGYQSGFSDTCVDSNEDGVCDVVYDVRNDTVGCDSEDCDYMPLTTMPFKIAPAYVTMPLEVSQGEEVESSGGSTNEKVRPFNPLPEDLKLGYKEEVVKGHEFIIPYDDGEYNFDVIDVSEEGVDLSFGDEKINLKEDSSYSMDLNGDGVNDLKISLLGSNAVLGVLEFQYIFPQSDTGVIINEENDVQISDALDESLFKTNAWPYIVLAVIILVLVVWFVLNKNKSSASKRKLGRRR